MIKADVKSNGATSISHWYLGSPGLMTQPDVEGVLENQQIGMIFHKTGHEREGKDPSN